MKNKIFEIRKSGLADKNDKGLMSLKNYRDNEISRFY